MQEVGVNWSVLNKQNQWRERIKEEFDMKCVKTKMSHNRQDLTREPMQWGGTGIMSLGKLTHFTMGAGEDPSKLGRWTWVRFRGKGGVTLRCVSVYRPCKSAAGQTTVYAQHKAYLQSQNDDRDPRDAFLQDLDNELAKWTEEGDQLILGGDLNDDVRSEEIATLMEKHSLRNLLFDRHDPQQAPSTFEWNNSDKVIDAIWGTPNIHAERCGFLEPGDFPGDHATIWVDITYHSALGHIPPLPQMATARRLQLQNPTTVAKYIKEYRKLATEKDLFNRQRRLQASISPGVPLTPPQQKIANNIDADKTKCMLKAEKKCRKLRMAAIKFSEATEAPRRRIEFWSLALKRRLGGKVSSRLWHRKKIKAKVTMSLQQMPTTTIRIHLTKARIDYRNAKRDHVRSRKSFIESFSPKVRDKIRRTEAQRDLGRAARRITGKLESKSVTKIEHDGQECTTKESIEAALLPINEAKYHACEGTPFLESPLFEEFGYKGKEETVQMVLDGTYIPPPDTDMYSRILLTHLAMPQNISPSNAAQISVEDHCRAWNKAKERTSAGMSGLHFGMFKAHAQFEDLATLDASMRSLAYYTGFAYERWKKGMDVQILKRSRDFRASKLRTILLLEADFNMNNKKLGKDAMWTGETTRNLTKDNYGGRKGLRPSEVSLNQQLTFNSIWARRGRAILISNDAKGCFDRISHVVALLALRRLGVPNLSLQSMIDAIQFMDHHIRTAFGDSTTSYGNDPSRPPPQGLLQGNGAGPAGWFAISSVIIDAMKACGFGYRQWTVIRKKAIQIVSFAFVDDTDIIHANNDPNVSTEQLIAEAQSALHHWEGLIRATGGELAPDKGYWYLIEVVRRGGRWKYRNITNAPGSLSLYNQNNPTEIERLKVSTSREALGIQSRPDCNMKDQVAYLLTKSKAWSDAVRTKRISKHEAWYCLTSTIMKTIEYPLTATTISRKQMTSIMAPILKTVLPKCGIQRHMPRALVYGTIRSQGCGLQDPWHTQLIEHLHALLRHWHRPTPTADLLGENIELVQCHIGSSVLFWELPYDLYSCLAPKGWIKFTWGALKDTCLTLKGPDDLVFKTLRLLDVHLMDAFIDMGYDERTLRLLNEIRLFLGVTTLAEICTADGRSISPTVWASKVSQQLKPTSWPKTHRPVANTWTFWQSKIRETFLHPHATHTRLRQPLGTWTCNVDTHDHWQWWYSPSTHLLFQRLNPSDWQRWTPHAQLTRRFLHNNCIQWQAMPRDLIHASVIRNRRLQWVTLESTGEHDPASVIPTPVPSSLYQTLEQLPPSANWAVTHTRITDNGTTIANALLNHQAIAVSDGSLKFEYGTTAFVLEGIDQTHRITGVAEVPGPVIEGDSHRPELTGLFCIVIMVNAICCYHNITSGSITIACDNIQAIRMFECDYLPEPNHPNYDLIQAIWGSIQASPITWKWQHVKGHQDKHRRVFTRFERLNIEMDRMAKSFWQYKFERSPLRNPTPIVRHIYNEGWSIWAGSSKIVSPNKKMLYELLQEPITQSYWIRHGRFRQPAVATIDWATVHSTGTKLPPSRRRWITKHASENCGVGTTLVEWEYQTDAECPRCGQEEDTTHVFRCTGHNANDTWSSSMADLEGYLCASATAPHIQQALVLCLNRWRNGQTVRNTEFHADLVPIIKAQSYIGWKNFLLGLPASGWRELQEEHLSTNNITGSSKKWATNLMIHINRLSWGQWEHRNHVKHRILKPRTRKALALLDRQITKELAKGVQDLPPGDRHHFQHNLIVLLRRSPAYKKAWFVNVTMARQRQARIRSNDDTLTHMSKEASLLIRWMKTGCCI